MSFLNKKNSLLPNWYGLSYFVSIIACLQFVKKHKHKWIFRRIALYIEPISSYFLFFCFLFARLGYFVTNSKGRWKNWYKIWQGGQSFFGSIVGGIFASPLCCRIYDIPFLELLDSCFYLAPIMISFVRIGNYLVNDFTGRFGLPISLIESFSHGFLIFFAIGKIVKKEREPGVVTRTFFKYYGYSRFLTEFLREPQGQYFINGLSLEQYFSLLFIFPRFIFLFIDQVLKHKMPQTRNYGFNLGLFSNLSLDLKICIQVVSAISMVVLLKKQTNIFLISGVLSNLYDRIKYGYVIDYIKTPLGICNLADIYVWIGITLVILPDSLNPTIS